MQPLNALNSVQKAKLLHALFYQEIPGLLTFTLSLCDSIETDKQSVIDKWENGIITPDFWISLAAETKRRIKRYRRELEKCSPSFSDQLFDGYGAIIMGYCLSQYIAGGKHTDPKFKTAVDLFFNP